MMDPKLVCKVVVDAEDGHTYRGSGYPIAANRIITAAHVVAEALNIRLFFGPQQDKIDTPVKIEWSGRDNGIDVAVLRCELPSQYHPYHRLLTTPPNTPMKWFAHGFTKIAQGSRTGDIDDYHGELTKFADIQQVVALESQDGPIQAEQWQGGSGSVAFDSDTSQIALAVITRYQGGKKTRSFGGGADLLSAQFGLDSGRLSPRDSIQFVRAAGSLLPEGHSGRRLKVDCARIRKSPRDCQSDARTRRWRRLRYQS
jgi:hypothetical protein